MSTVAVAVAPGAAVCLLAGTARMSPGRFTALNVVGTALRVLAIRGAGTAAAGLVAGLLALVGRFRAPVTAATAALSMASAAPVVTGLLRMRRKAADEAAAGGGGGGGGGRAVKPRSD